MDASYKLEIFISDHVAAEEVSILSIISLWGIW